MQINVLWTGREYHSLENCLVKLTDAGAEVASTILGSYEGKIYKVEYLIRTNQHWETTSLEISSRHSDNIQSLRFEGNGKGRWTSNGKEVTEFNGCVDVDITLTPFTNTLPIRRLKLMPMEHREISVIYCDLLAARVSAVRQKYTRLSDTQYQYENVPNDFEAIIEVDEHGLVVDYPMLFVRTAALRTTYH